jgi:hypothetical protein
MCGLTTTVTTTATTDGSRRHPSGTFRDGPIRATSVIAQPEKRQFDPAPDPFYDLLRV